MNSITSTIVMLMASIVFSQNDLEKSLVENYSISRDVSQGQDDARVNLESADAGYLPRLSLTQSLQSTGYQTPSIQVTLGSTYNILDGKRTLQSKLADLQLRFAQLESGFEKTAALFNLRQYLQALNTYELGIMLLRGIETDIRKQRPLWLPSTPAKQFAPNEIELYTKFLEFVDTRKVLEVQAQRLRKQIAKWTKIDVTELAEGRIEFAGDPVLLAPVQIAACVDGSAAVQRAGLRLEQERVFEALRNDASPVLALSAQLAATTAPAAGQSALSAQAALTLTIPLPPNNPISGNGVVSVGTAGATQTATLSYPNQFRQADPRGVYWAELNLADTKEASTDDLRESLRSRENLISSVLLAKQRLEWGERSLRDAGSADALVKLGARFALMGLKVRGAYDHLNLQLNTLTLAQTCQLGLTYAPRDAVFDVPKTGGS